MKIKQIIELIHNDIGIHHQDILKLIDEGYLDENKEINLEHFNENEIWETLYDAAIENVKNNELIYYSECADFLTSNKCPTDFSEAINVGCKDLTSIANYYYREVNLEEFDESIHDFINELKEFKEQYEFRLNEFNEIQNKINTKSNEIPQEIHDYLNGKPYFIFNIEAHDENTTIYDVVSFKEINKGVVWYGPIHYNDKTLKFEDEDPGPSISSNLNDLPNSITSELCFSVEDGYAYGQIIKNKAIEYCNENNIKLNFSKEREM